MQWQILRAMKTNKSDSTSKKHIAMCRFGLLVCFFHSCRFVSFHFVAPRNHMLLSSIIPSPKFIWVFFHDNLTTKRLTLVEKQQAICATLITTVFIHNTYLPINGSSKRFAESFCTLYILFVFDVWLLSALQNLFMRSNDNVCGESVSWELPKDTHAHDVDCCHSVSFCRRRRVVVFLVFPSSLSLFFLCLLLLLLSDFIGKKNGEKYLHMLKVFSLFHGCYAVVIQLVIRMR